MEETSLSISRKARDVTKITFTNENNCRRNPACLCILKISKGYKSHLINVKEEVEAESTKISNFHAGAENHPFTPEIAEKFNLFG